MSNYFPADVGFDWLALLNHNPKLIQADKVPSAYYIQSNRIGINVTGAPDDVTSTHAPWLTIGGKVCIGSDQDVLPQNATSYNGIAPDLWVIGRIGVSEVGISQNNPFTAAFVPPPPVALFVEGGAVFRTGDVAIQNSLTIATDLTVGGVVRFGGAQTQLETALAVVGGTAAAAAATAAGAAATAAGAVVTAGTAATTAGNAVTTAGNAATTAGNAATTAGNAAITAGNAAITAGNAATTAAGAAAAAAAAQVAANATASELHNASISVNPNADDPQPVLHVIDGLVAIDRTGDHRLVEAYSLKDLHCSLRIKNGFVFITSDGQPAARYRTDQFLVKVEHGSIHQRWSSIRGDGILHDGITIGAPLSMIVPFTKKEMQKLTKLEIPGLTLSPEERRKLRSRGGIQKLTEEDIRRIRARNPRYGQYYGHHIGQIGNLPPRHHKPENEYLGLHFVLWPEPPKDRGTAFSRKDAVLSWGTDPTNRFILRYFGDEPRINKRNRFKPDWRTWNRNRAKPGRLNDYELSGDKVRDLVVVHPNGRVEVNGSVFSYGHQYLVSDLRMKREVKPIAHALHKVLSMRGVGFRWKDEDFEERNFDDSPQLGFIAQEVEKVCPEAVTSDDDGFKAVDYASLMPVLNEAIREQQLTIDSQTKKIQELEVSVHRLELCLRQLLSGRK